MKIILTKIKEDVYIHDVLYDVLVAVDIHNNKHKSDENRAKLITS